MAKIDIKVRRATLDDYQDVLDIDRDMYDGTDYLPSKYCDYMRDHNRAAFVCEYNGKVVGFRMLYMVDEGRTAVSEGARVHPDYRSKGLFKHTHAALLKYLVEEQPNAEVLAGVSPSWHLYANTDLWSLLGYRMAVCISIPWVSEVPPAVMKEVVTSDTYRQTERLSKERAIALASDKNVQWRLFPTGQLLVALEPFKVMESNFRTIADNSAAIYGSFDRRAGAEARSMSFGNAFETKVGLIYRLDYYGEDDSDVMMHFMCHYKLLAERVAKGRLAINLYLAPTMDHDRVVSVLKTFDGMEFYIPGVEKRKIYIISAPTKILTKARVGKL